MSNFSRPVEEKFPAVSSSPAPAERKLYSLSELAAIIKIVAYLATTAAKATGAGVAMSLPDGWPLERGKLTEERVAELIRQGLRQVNS